MKNKWLVIDDENDQHFFDTEEEAMAFAEDVLETCREDASETREWSDTAGDIFVAKIVAACEVIIDADGQDYRIVKVGEDE